MHLPHLSHPKRSGFSASSRALAHRASRPVLAICMATLAALQACSPKDDEQAAATESIAPALPASGTASEAMAAVDKPGSFTADATANPEGGDAAVPADVVRTFTALTDRYGILRKYLQVKPGLDDAALTALARTLHGAEPETWFWLLDDDAQAPALIEALPRTAQGDNTGYPIDWVQAHTVANLRMEVNPDGGERWVLARGWGSDVITTLD